MGRNNENAGIHFVRFRESDYSLYDYDSFIDKVNSIAKRKPYDVIKREIIKTDSAKINTSENLQIDDKKEYAKMNDVSNTMDEVYENAALQIESLFARLFVAGIKYHKDLGKLSKQVSLHFKDGVVDDLTFITMVSQLMGFNLLQVLSINQADIEEVVAYVIKELNNNEENYTLSIYEEEDVEYIEDRISLIDNSKEDDIRNYYMNLKEAALSGQMDSLPNIYTSYDVTIYRIKGKDNVNTYVMTISIGRDREKNYLGYYQAEIYCEREGMVADFFEKIVNKNSRG